MSTVSESRVVEMRFDNQQFEANAKETLNTLEQLKRALETNINGDAFNELDRAARNVDLSGIEAGIEALTDRFSTLGIVGMTVIQNITNAITGTLGRAISSVTDSIMGGGFRRATNIENARFQLQGILGDAEKVTEVMNNASKSVDGTAYALDSAANAASQLAASGVQAGDEMTNVLKGIAGVAATTSTDYEGISRIFTQIAGNGRVMGDQLLQLSNRGLNAAATLKDYFNGVKNGTIEATDAVKQQIAALTGASSLVKDTSNAISSSSQKSYDTAKKAADNEYNLKKKTYDKEYKELQKALNNEYNAKKKAYDQQYKALQETLNNEVEAVQEANSKRIEELQEAYERDVEAYRDATNEKIALINEEYTESIKLIDEERYNKIKAVEDQIKAIQDQAKAEQKALKDQANQEKLNTLESLAQNSKGTVTRMKAAQELAEFQAELAREQLAEDRANQIEDLQNQKSAINEEAQQKKEEAQEKAQAAKEAVQEESSAELKAMQKAHQAELTQLRKQQAEELSAMREANSERLAALRESQNEELSVYKEGQNEQLEAFREKQNEELTLLRESQNEMLSSMKTASGSASKYAAKFGGAMDLTEADIRDMVSNGLISFDIFSEAMATIFGEHAYDANKTFQGAMSNIRAALARTGAMFITPLITEGAPLIDLLNEIRLRINEINKVLTPIAEIVTGKINEVIPKITEQIHQLRFAVSYTIENARKGNEDVTKFTSLGNSLMSVLKGIGNILVAVGSYIKPVIEAFREVFTLDFGNLEKGSKSFENFTKTLKASGNTSRMIRSIFMSLFSIIKNGVGVVKSILGAFKPLFELFGIGDGILGDLLAGVTGLIDGFTRWLTTSEKVQKVFSTITGYVQKFVNAVKQVAGAVSDAFDANFKFISIGTNFSEGFIEGMKSLVPKAVKAVIEFGKAVMQAILDLFQIESPSKWAIWVVEMIIEGFLKIVEFTKKAVNAALSVFREVGKAIEEFFSQFDWQGVILNAITGATEFVNNFSSTIANGIPQVIQTVKDFFASIKEGIKGDTTGEEAGSSFFHSFLEGLKGAAVAVWDGIKLIFTTLFNNIREELKDFSIKEAAATAKDFVKNLAENIINKIKEFSGPVGQAFGSLFGNVTLGGLAAGAAGIGILVLLIKLAKQIRGIVNPFEAFKKAINGTTKALKSLSFDLKADAILKIAEAVAVLVAAIGLLYLALGDMDGADALKLTGVVIIVGAMLTAVTLAVGYLMKIKAAMDQATTATQEIAKGVKSLAKSKAMQNNVETFVGAITKIVTSLATLTLLNEFYGDSLRTSIGFFVIITTCVLAAVAVFAAISSHIENGQKTFNNTALGFLELAAALYIIISSIEKVVNMDLSALNSSPEVFGGLIVVLAVVIGVIFALVKLNNKLEENKGSLAASPIIAFCVLVLVTIFALKKLINMGADIVNNFGQLAMLAGIYLILVLVLKAIVKVTKVGEKEGIASLGGTLFGICAFLIVSVAAIGILSMMPVDKYLTGLAYLVGLFAALWLACQAAGKVTSGDGWKSILAIAAVIAVLIAALGILSMLDPSALLPAAGSLAAVLTAFALALAGAGTMDDSKNVWSILAMILSIVVISGMLKWLQDIPWDQLLGTAGAISSVLLAFAAAIWIISNSEINLDWGLAAAYIGGLVAIVVIAAILKAFSGEDWDSMLGLAGGISAVLIALAVCIRIMDGVSVDLSAMAVFAEAIVAVVAVGDTLVKAAQYDWQDLLGAGIAIAVTLIAMAVCCGIASLLGSVAGPAIVGMGVLDLFIVNLTAVLAALGLLAQDEKIVKIVKDGGEFLALIGKALGAFVGSIVEGAIEKVAESLPVIGENLAEFAKKADPFFETLKSMDSGTAEAAKALAGVVLALGAAEMMDAITNIFSFFTGSDDQNSFGEKLASFGESLSEFANKTQGINGFQLKNVAEGGKALIEMAKEIPNEGGFLAKIVGENDLALFGEKLASFAGHLAVTAAVLAGVDVSRFPEIAEAMDSMIKMATSIPNTGGWLGDVVGNNDIDDFGKRLSKFSSYLLLVGMNFKMTDTTRFKSIATAMESMITMATSIPNSGGWLDTILGSNDIDDFGQKLVLFSQSMADMGEILKSTNLKKIEDLGPAIESLVNIAVTIKQNQLGDKGNSLTNFGERMVEFGTKIKEFNDEKINSVTNIDKLNTTLTKFIGIIPMLTTFTATNFTKFLKDLGTYGDDGLKKFLNAFNNPETKINSAIGVMFTSLTSAINKKLDQMQARGKSAVDNFATGLSNKTDSLQRGAKALINNTTNEIRSYENQEKKFEKTGEFVVAGFVRGIRNKLDDAKGIGRELGDAAYNAARRALDERSPSKKMAEVGSYAGEGFVNGFAKWIKASSVTATELGESAHDGLKEALDNISTEIQNEDLINPVITPVLDLSDVQKQASNIDDMLNSNRTIDLATAAKETLNAKDILSMIGEAAKENAMRYDQNAEAYQQTFTDMTKMFQYMMNKFGNLQVVMDTGALVGEISSPVDDQIGFYSVLNERGVR